MGTPTGQVVATISAFILAMVLFPDAQHKAQEEIDRVVGPGRLPNFTDREHLPYLSALYKELLRWHIIGPMGNTSFHQSLRLAISHVNPGIPHSATQDDWYGDYFIPKGSLVMSNLWRVQHLVLLKLCQKNDISHSQKADCE